MKSGLRRQGFTLVELLVVVVIIGILAGIVLKLQTLVGERAARAQTLARIENIKLCLEEYYRQEGEYPPQSSDPINRGTECEGFDHTVRRTQDVNWEFKMNTFPSYVRSDYTGLVYYIYPGTNLVLSDGYRLQPARWKEYFDAGVGLNTWEREYGGTSLSSEEYTNIIYRLLDGWDQQFVYICTTNDTPGGRDYQTFQLYSKGIDASSDDDDIGRGGMGE